jgi:hypothetical protein
VRCLHIVDEGLAVVLILALVVGAGRRLELGRGQCLLLLLLVLAIPHLEMRGNTSSVLTGVVLVVSWFRLLIEGDLDRVSCRRAAALSALVLAALCSLKSTFIPLAVAAFACTSLAVVVRGPERRRAVGEIVLTVVLIGVCVLPWMISVFESSHTLLYPIFGRGFYGAEFTDNFADVAGSFGVPLTVSLAAMVRLLVPMWPVVVLLFVLGDRRPRAPATALAVAAVLTGVLLVLMGDPELDRSLSRYIFPVQVAALLGLAMAAMRGSGTRPRGVTRAEMAAVAVVVVTLGLGEPAAIRLYARVLGNVAAAVAGGDFLEPPERQVVSELQDALPEDGEPLLATLPHPFLLDFGKRPIYIMSLPAMAGLPPGLPVSSGGEAVARYLTDKSIRYLAYGGVGALHDLLALTEEQILIRYPRSKMRWVMLRYHQRYRKAVEDLANSRKRLYSDPANVLLDLKTRVTTIVPRERTESLEGFIGGVWTTGDSAIHDIGCEPCGRFLVLTTNGWHPYGRDADRLGLCLEADGRPLELMRTTEHGFLFRMPAGADRVGELRIRSEVIAAGSTGSASETDQLGVDVRAIEISDHSSIADRPIQRAAVTLAGVLRPERIWGRAGFYRDFNWTNGDGFFGGLSWPVRGGKTELVLSLFKAHPFGADWSRLDVRVEVNGVELPFLRAEGFDLHFALYENLREISTLRIRSSTFVPRELNGSTDERVLGIPVREVRLE